MKKTIAIIVSLIFVLSFAGLSFAADKPAAEKKAEPAKAAPAAAEKKAEPAKAAPAKVKQVTGDVAAVDAKAGTITVKGKKGDTTVATDAKTKIMMGKDVKAIADVKVGDKVTVKFSEADGKMTAKSVAIKAAEKKAEPAKKAEPVKAEKKAEPAKTEKK
jgi:thioredoxin-dependent peroxiredoxin